MAHYSLELYDKVNLMCRKQMDGMVRVMLEYGFAPEEETFRAVYRSFLEQCPIFHAAVHKHPISPSWRVAEYDEADALTFVRGAEDVSAETERFFTQAIPLESALQIKVRVFLSENSSRICLLWNHMLMDGGGFKAFWADFCKAYETCRKGGSCDGMFRNGSRAYYKVYKDMPTGKKIRANLQFFNRFPRDKHAFPFPSDEGDETILSARLIPGEIFDRARALCKQKSVTVNDLLIAGFLRAYIRMTETPLTDSVNVSSAVDLRRYMKDLEGIGYTNHVTFMHCEMPRMAETMAELVDIAHQTAERQKKDPWLGLHGLPLITIGFNALPFFYANWLIGLIYSNALLTVSNVGSFAGGAYALEGHEAQYALIYGGAKKKPNVMMTAVSAKKGLYLSFSEKGDGRDREAMDRFLAYVEEAFSEFLADEAEQR